MIEIPNKPPTLLRKFQCTFLGGNNNKWWNIELWQLESIVRITYGRVGQECVRPFVYSGDIRFVEKKIQDKVRSSKEDSRYTEIKLHTPTIVLQDDVKIDSKILKRVNKIFQAANESISKTLLGNVDALSQEQIEEGRKLLKIISVEKHSKVLEKTIGSYYNTIPTNLGHKINLQQVIMNLCSHITEEDDRLNQLEAALTSYQIKTQGGSVLDQLGCEIHFVTKEEEAEIKEVFKSPYKEAWKILINPERKAFEAETKGSENVQMLIHGTKDAYIRHILRKGLILPNNAQGLFGAGIYFADEWEKSASYSGGSEKCYLLSKVKLGRMYKPKEYKHWHDVPAELGDSVLGEKKKKIAGVYNGFLNYNEYIVYKTSQQSIHFLIIKE